MSPEIRMHSLTKLAGCAVALAALALPGCHVPVRAARSSPDTVYRSIHANALTEGDVSAESMLVLQRASLVDAWDHDPAAAIAQLHDLALADARRDRLFALAELSLLVGEDTDDRRHHLASAVYAYLFLFGAAERTAPDAYDPRFRVACDLHNRALAEAFRGDDGEHFVPAAGRLPLPRGVLWTAAEKTFPYGGYSFERFLPADDYDVRGLRARVRSPGLGAALIAGRAAAEDEPNVLGGFEGHLPPRMRVPVTAFLRVHGELEDMGGEGMTARLELHHGAGAPSTTVRGNPVRFQTDTTTPLAYTLGHSLIWAFELASMLNVVQASLDPGLYFMAPYTPGRIPVVLVHGTASSPARWVEMVNEMTADPVLASNCQVWLFLYPTGRPILASARDLRDAIHDVVAEVDPHGRDPALSQMVIVGHSQGGLLTRLQATKAGKDDFWRNFSNAPLADLDLDDAARATLADTFFFEPSPYVRRVVFMSTPHGGSFLAHGWLGELGRSLMAIPLRMAKQGRNMLAKNTGLLRYSAVDEVPNAVDNMNPSSDFVATLRTLPIAPGIRSHSVIPVIDPDDPRDEWNDGVVKYSSAHLEGVDSELIVPHSGHSVQHHPAGVAEVRRILRLHLERARAEMR